MKQEDDYYERWLDKLKTTQPVLAHPDELTAAIMQRVSQNPGPTESLPPGRMLRKPQKLLLLGSWASGVAAGLLLCVLLGETFFPSLPVAVEKEKPFTWKVASFVFPAHWEEMTTVEKSRYVSSVCQYRELRRTQKECLLETRVKYHIKSTDYEKG